MTNLIEALEAAKRLFDEALPKFNWGASFLDANAIELLNTVPVKVNAAIEAAKRVEPVTADMMLVAKEDANNYCRILTRLGMEEEGDPVSAIEALLNQSTRLAPDHVAAKLIAVAHAAFRAADDSEEVEGADGRQHVIGAQDFDALSDALDALEELPDDKPGCTHTRYDVPLYLAPPAQPVPAVTDGMAYAFHNAIGDGSLGANEVEEIKTGLRAALAAAPEART